MELKDKKEALLEYARFYGIARDHLECSPFESLPFLLEYLHKEPDDSHEDFSDFGEIEAAARSPLPERLTIDRHSLTYLRELRTEEQLIPQWELLPELDPHRIRNLKQELPLLRTDHETDMLDFPRRMEVDLKNEFIPLEKVDEEQDEGLTWPTKYKDFADAYFKDLREEKLGISRDVLAYMQDALDFDLESEQFAFEYEKTARTKRVNSLQVDSPLVPLSPPTESYEASLETRQSECLTENSSPATIEMEETDNVFLRDDVITQLILGSEVSDSVAVVERPPSRASSKVGNVCDPLEGNEEDSSILPPGTRRLQDEMVEATLTHVTPYLTPHLEKKEVSFSESWIQIDPDIRLPSPIPGPRDASTDEINATLMESTAPTAVQVVRDVEQERLCDADMPRKLPVPVLDFSQPKALWDQGKDGQDKEKLCREMMGKLQVDYFDDILWPVDTKTLLELSWVPFPSSIGQFELQEEIVDDGALKDFIAWLEESDFDSSLWKREGFRLSNETDEEELDFCSFPEAKDIGSLIRKRKLELADDEPPGLVDIHTELTKQRESALPPRTAGSVKKCSISKEVSLQIEKYRDVYESRATKFSAEDALDMFINVRKGNEPRTRPRLGQERHLETQPSHPAGEEVHHRGIDTDAEIMRLTESISTRSPVIPLLETPIASSSFVVSTSFLANRKLWHQILKLCPSATFIERDFAANALMPQRSLQVPSKTTDVEADIILSPTTGLIVTTLQKIKQQALPGNMARSPIRERVHNVSARYERLLVVVHLDGDSFSNGQEGLNTDVGRLDEYDCEAFASFTAYLANLPEGTKGQSIFVACNATSLATWIVGLMIKYGVPVESGMSLLQEETQWEVFLRQTGLNAYGAQVMLGEMKQLREREGRDWGLDHLVKIGPHERIKKFEGVIGGRILLARLSKVLDGQWEKYFFDPICTA